MNKQGDLSVITKAKEVCSYILTITDKPPKRFRFTLVSRLQNYSLTIIENLILANEIYVCNNRRKLLRRWTFKAWTYMEIKKTYLFQYYIYKIEGGFR